MDPDFSILCNGEYWYWKHWGRMDEGKYRNHRFAKLAWYEKQLTDRLVETFERKTLSTDANEIIKTHFS